MKSSMRSAGGGGRHEIGRIAEIWRYPVQSMRGESAGSGRHRRRRRGRRPRLWRGRSRPAWWSPRPRAPKWRDIVTLAARCWQRRRTADAAAGRDPPARRHTLSSDQRDIDERLAAILGAPVHLADSAAENKRSSYSHAPLHLLTTASLAAFRHSITEGRFAPARFRPNIVIDTGEATGYPGAGWIERSLQIGDGVRISITEHCKRCVMTTLPQGDLPFDPAILHTATAENSTRAGVYADVRAPGAIKVGDPVTLL